MKLLIKSKEKKKEIRHIKEFPSRVYDYPQTFEEI